MIIVDEAHTARGVGGLHPDMRGQGHWPLGDPFQRWPGKLFSNLVNAATMHELTESGVLVPMRVKSCHPINMDGAATSGGEWTDAAAGERGMGDCRGRGGGVAPARRGRKTIVFGSTIAHCAELCKSFNEAGVMAQLFTRRRRGGAQEHPG